MDDVGCLGYFIVCLLMVFPALYSPPMLLLGFILLFIAFGVFGERFLSGTLSVNPECLFYVLLLSLMLCVIYLYHRKRIRRIHEAYEKAAGLLGFGEVRCSIFSVFIPNFRLTYEVDGFKTSVRTVWASAGGAGLLGGVDTFWSVMFPRKKEKLSLYQKIVKQLQQQTIQDNSPILWITVYKVPPSGKEGFFSKAGDYLDMKFNKTKKYAVGDRVFDSTFKVRATDLEAADTMIYPAVQGLLLKEKDKIKDKSLLVYQDRIELRSSAMAYDGGSLADNLVFLLGMGKKLYQPTQW